MGLLGRRQLKRSSLTWLQRPHWHCESMLGEALHLVIVPLAGCCRLHLPCMQPSTRTCIVFTAPPRLCPHRPDRPRQEQGRGQGRHGTHASPPVAWPVRTISAPPPPTAIMAARRVTGRIVAAGALRQPCLLRGRSKLDHLGASRLHQ